jgi:hypothetical protein
MIFLNIINIYIKNIKMEIKEQVQDRDIEYIIPFIHRKSLLLSISFRALNLEMSEFKMKVESLYPDELKEPLITGLCETTMVNIKNI